MEIGLLQKNQDMLAPALKGNYDLKKKSLQLY